MTSSSKKSGCHVQHHNCYQYPGKIQRNLMIQFQENTQMPGSKDGQTLFHGILPATARGLAKKTAINWHLKVKNIEYNVGLTNNQYITVSMQKASSINKLIQEILGSYELSDYTHFDQTHPKSIEITFCFLEFVPPSKKSVHFINSFLKYRQLQSPVSILATPISSHAYPKIF